MCFYSALTFAIFVSGQLSDLWVLQQDDERHHCDGECKQEQVGKSAFGNSLHQEGDTD
jgi:hypothetical protein